MKQELRDSERVLKQAAALLDVPVPDVPKVIKNILAECSELDAQIKALKI